MGKHSRLTRGQHMQATAFKAAAALGVASTIAVSLHSVSVNDESSLARSGVSSQPGLTDDGTGLASSAEETGTPTPASSSLSPAASAEPKLVADRTDDARNGHSRTDSATTDGTAARTLSANGDGTAEESARDTQKYPGKNTGISASSPDEAPTAEAPTASEQPDEQPPATEEERRGLVGSVVDGVGGVVGGVTGHLGL